ncbi:MAG: acyl-CoA dehydrogenase family protein [Blastococcus sp.]|nr:acyl-CoA dehydrogenase family protein [Blastococcus sp.]
MTHPQNFATADPALVNVLSRLLDAGQLAWLTPHLDELGALAATDIDAAARTADVNPPTLRQWDPAGERVDEVVHHPAYRHLEEIAYGRFGLAAMSHRPGVLGCATLAPHVAKYALSYLFVQSEFGLACPLSMTDSAARVLRLFDEEKYAEAISRLTATDRDGAWTGAMFMTERAGGTDLAQTESLATDCGDHWQLSGRKWFASNVSADVILTLAVVPGQGEGTRGLGMFYVPRTRADGSRNSYTIDRLKDKLGTRSMASGEVTLAGAWAQPVGDLSRGFRQMAEMVNVSRLSNAMRSSALMRRAVREAVDHARGRVVFGRPLFEQPLMRVTLLSLALQAEAAMTLVLETAAVLDAADAGDATARKLIRIMTPLAKYTICKEGRRVTGEAMEVRGGNGYIEDWVDPRLVRDAHLPSIWEGSSNVIALDVLRCMRKEALHATLTDHQVSRLEELTGHDCAPGVAWLRSRWTGLRTRGDALLALEPDRQEARVGTYARDLARTSMATTLLVQAAHDLDRTGSHRTLLVAFSWILALSGVPEDELHAALDELGPIIDGGDVPASSVKTLLDDAAWAADA